ncbi:MAG: Mur ligase family protein [bacterium]
MRRSDAATARRRRALRYLDAIDPRDIRPGLERVREALARLDHPERRLRIVRVGGTNGKGSVSALIAAALQRSGLAVGLYTSPHLVDVRERIRVNGAAIGWAALANGIARVRRAIERPPAVRLTYFELVTVVALLEMVRRRVDVAVLEVGLGGRWDATNVGLAPVAVLTNVELDHTEFLGTTRRAIAREKVEIASPGGTLVTGVASGAARCVIDAHARAHGIAVQTPPLATRGAGAGGVVSYRGKRLVLERAPLGLLGAHQVGNAVLALRALECIAELGLAVDAAAVRAALAETRWPGRLDVVRGHPTWIFDGAHNPHGAAASARALGALVAPFAGPRVVVVGALRTKSPERLLGSLRRVPWDAVVCTTVPRADAVAAAELVDSARRAGMPAHAVAPWPRALSRARALARADGVVVVIGSLYLVGAAMKRLGVPVTLTRRRARVTRGC